MSDQSDRSVTVSFTQSAEAESSLTIDPEKWYWLTNRPLGESFDSNGCLEPEDIRYYCSYYGVEVQPNGVVTKSIQTTRPMELDREVPSDTYILDSIMEHLSQEMEERRIDAFDDKDLEFIANLVRSTGRPVSRESDNE